MRKSPDFWLEFALTNYPSDTVQDTLRLAQTRMAWPTFIQSRVMKERGWSDINRKLSDWMGNPTASVLNAAVEDSDGVIRRIAQEIGRTAYAKVETVLNMLSREGRVANLTPRIVHRGFLQRGPQAMPRAQARLQAVDAAGSQWFGLYPGATLQKHFINREYLEACGINGTPKDLIGKPYNIIIGEHTDQGQVDANGQPNAIGMLPVDELGSVVRTAENTIPTEETHVTQIPPPILSAEVIGTPGDETYFYAVSALTKTGETVWSNIVTVTDAPSTDEMSTTRYVELTWEIPAGWEQIYKDYVIAYRIGGRFSNPPDEYLDMNRNGDPCLFCTETEAGGDPVERGYRDGAHPGTGTVERVDVDHEKPPPAPAVGTATVVLTTEGDPSTVTTHTQWFLFCWAFGYCEMNQLYGAALEIQNAETERVLLDFDHPDLMTPKSAAWPHPSPWIDLDDGAGNPLRISGFYARGFYAEQHRTGTVTFAINGCGVTDTGDDTGNPITEASEGFIWVADRLGLDPDYRGGSGWALQLFSNGESILNTTLIRAFQAITQRWIGGRGYQMHLHLAEKITYGTFEQWFNRTFCSFTGDLDNGQRAVWVIDPEVDPAAQQTYRQHIEIGNQSLPENEDAVDELENELAYKYDWNPDLRTYRGDAGIIRDIDSIKMNKLHKQDLELRCTRDKLTADNAMGWRLFHNQVAPIYQDVPTNMFGIEQDVGTMLRLTHDDGPYENGYPDQLMFTIGKRIKLNRPRTSVTLTARVVRNDELLPGNEFTVESISMPFVMSETA